MVSKRKTRWLPLLFCAAVLLCLVAYILISCPRRYEEIITVCSEQYGVPAELIAAVIATESGYRVDACSEEGAIGLMQMMPETYVYLAGLRGETADLAQLRIPAVSIDYGTYYLSLLYARYRDWEHALAAYNAGIGNVDAWLLREDCTDRSGHLVRIPFGETARYVKKVRFAQNVYHLKNYFGGR